MKEIESPNIEDKIKTDINKICKDLPVYKKITKVEIRKNEFEKTTTNKIKR